MATKEETQYDVSGSPRCHPCAVWVLDRKKMAPRCDEAQHPVRQLIRAWMQHEGTHAANTRFPDAPAVGQVRFTRD